MYIGIITNGARIVVCMDDLTKSCYLLVLTQIHIFIGRYVISGDLTFVSPEKFDRNSNIAH